MQLKVDDRRVRATIGKLVSSAGLRRGLLAASLYLKGKLAYYPPSNPRPQAQNWSDKQRRGFFAALREGSIEVPYRRAVSPQSERMRERWQLAGSGDGLTHTITNNASYVSLVIGQKQTAYHKQGGWRTVQDTIRQERSVIGRMVADEIAKDLKAA